MLLMRYLILLYFFVLTLLMRFPFFFQDVIDWDESTFILLGQSVLDGYLPYTDLLDVKPPLLSVVFGLFIFVLGKSIVAVRLAGAICVTVVAWFTYIVGKKIWNYKTGLLAGTLFIFIVSFILSGQATMSEHLALVPLMGAIVLVANSKLTPRRLFWVGFLITVASMIRLNLAYVVLIVGFVTTLNIPFQGQSFLFFVRSVALRGLAYTTGSVVVVSLTFLPYLLTGQFSVWWQNVVVLSLNYASSQLSWLRAMQIHFDTILFTIFERGKFLMLAKPFGIAFISLLVWLGGLLGLAIVAIRTRKKISGWQRRDTIALVVFFASTGLSIVRGGAAFPHYLIQLVPFAALFAAAGFTLVFEKARNWQIAIALFLSIAIAIQPILPEYRQFQLRAMAGKALRHGPAYEIADYLKQANGDRKPVYMAIDHIVYWLVEQKPLTNLIHPSNISRNYVLEVTIGSGTTTEIELARLLAHKPEFIVTLENIWYLENKDIAKALFEETLRTDYRLVKEIQGRQIYQRR